jgi:multidrug efflux pump subunit AcrA (membrane-fusion protein)
MLDPSILVGPNAHAATLGQVSPLMPDALVAVQQAAEAETRTLAAAIEMLSALDSCRSLDEAAHQTTGSLCELLSATRVVILWRHRPKSGLAVFADSDDQHSSQQNNECRMLVAAGEEIAARNSITQWSCEELGDRHALMAVAQLAKSLSATSLTGIALSDSGGHDRGVVLAINPADSPSPNTLSINFLHAVGPSLASKLVGIQGLQPTAFEHALRGFVDLARGSQRNLILTVLVALGLVLLLPLPYKISAELELQPVQQRFIAVPFDGPLESSHVRPGDIVSKGDLLATINPREVEYELASIRAELNRAVQEKKGLMAEHDFAGSKIAALESERLRLQTDLLQYRRDNLEIHSPLSGVVVSGDLKQSEGMPMSRGETLFEIAPLGEMVVEIAVPESDIVHARTGMQVDFYVHALPTRPLGGTVSRIHPRAELRNHDNVYIAEVRISDAENILRPGMRGRAKIISDRHPLGWNLFHKAYFALRHATGW